MLKKHESEDMIKTEARKTWSDHVHFTLQNRFPWTFKVLKTHELPGALPPGPLSGALPLDPPDPKVGPWTPPVLGFTASRSQCGLCPHVIPHLGIWGKWKCATPRSQHPAHATAPMQYTPGIYVQLGGG